MKGELSVFSISLQSQAHALCTAVEIFRCVSKTLNIGARFRVLGATNINGTCSVN